MSETEKPALTPPSAEHRKIAAQQFQRANQVITDGQHDYGIQLLLTCCKLDPANVAYRQALRRVEKAKYKNPRGGMFSALSSTASHAKVKSALRGSEMLKVLEIGEEALSKNPWDTSIIMDMAEAADRLGQIDLAIWLLIDAREKDPKDPHVNRALAKLCEKRGNFAEAMKLWNLVKQALPADAEANRRANDAAVSHTIVKGQYEADGHSGAKPGTDEESALPGPLRNSGLVREETTLRARIQAEPTNVHPYMQLATFYRRAGRLDEARGILQQGLGPTGNHFELSIELAELDLEPFRKNLSVVEEKLRADPDDDELRQHRAKLHKEINSREMDLFRAKAERFPSELIHRLELGIRLLKSNQIDEAIRELQQARSDQRCLWKALMYLGFCFRNRNNWRLAKRNFEESLQSMPPGEDTYRKEVLYQLAHGCAQAGDFEAAIDLGHDLANLDFNFRDIAMLLDDWQARLDEEPGE